jgi:hypothetical protein
VGDIEDRHRCLLVDAADFVLDFLAQLLVERRERLVHQQDRGIVDQRPGQCHALLLAARHMRRHPVFIAFKPDEAQRLANPCSDFRLWFAADAKGEGDVLADREVRKQRVALEHHADIALVRWRGKQALAFEQNVARGRILKTGENVERR